MGDDKHVFGAADLGEAGQVHDSAGVLVQREERAGPARSRLRRPPTLRGGSVAGPGPGAEFALTARGVAEWGLGGCSLPTSPATAVLTSQVYLHAAKTSECGCDITLLAER